MAFLSGLRQRNPMDELMSYVGNAQRQSRPASGADVRGAFGMPAPQPVAPRQSPLLQETARGARRPRQSSSVTIEIDGIGQVQMGPEFNRLSPEQQEAAVQEVVASMGGEQQEPQGYDASLPSQGLSGVNTGIANLLGTPVDLATMALNAVPAGIDAVAGTNLGRIENPALGGEWFRQRGRDLGAIRPESSDPAARFIRRAGESVGGAAIPVAATARTGAQVAMGLGSALGGGIGGATAREIAPGNPIAELGGEMLGSLGTAGALAGVARRNAGRAARNAVPTTDQLRQQASDLYQRAEARGIVATPAATARIARSVGDIARNQQLITPTGRVSTAYPRAAEAMQLLDDYAGAPMTPTQIQVVRETLADARSATQGKERRIASMMLRAFDDATVPLAPELAQARGVASRYLQADRIAQARELAEVRSSQFSNSGPENALRTEFRNLDRRVTRGQEQFNPDVEQAIRNVSRGTPMSNAARNVGRLAPTGVVSAGLGGGVPFMVGNMLGGPAVGGAMAGGTMALGGVGRALATRQTEQAAEMAELIARNGGNLGINAPASQVLGPASAAAFGQAVPYATQGGAGPLAALNDDFVRQMAASEPRQAEYEDEERRRRRLLGLPGY